MVDIDIPKRDLPALKALADLGAAQFKSLISAIRDTKPTFAGWQFARSVSENVKAIHESEIAAILRVAFVLHSMKEKTGKSSQELSNAVAESYFKVRSKDDHFSSKQAKALSNRIVTLLSFDKTIGVTAKAAGVMTDHTHTFCRARILSDIRPVFTDSVESASAAVIIHNLQIGFHDGGTGDHKEFYVALDTNDVQALKEVIARAEKKTVALKAILNNSKVPYLEV